MSIRIHAPFSHRTPQTHDELLRSFASDHFNGLPDYARIGLDRIREIQVKCDGPEPESRRSETFFVCPLQGRSIEILTERQLTELFTREFQEFALHNWTEYEIFLFIYLISEDENAEKHKKDFYVLLERMVMGNAGDKAEAKVGIQRKINENVQLRDFLKIAFHEFFKEMEQEPSRLQRVKSVIGKVFSAAVSPLKFACETGSTVVKEIVHRRLMRSALEWMGRVFNLDSLSHFDHKKQVGNFLVKLSVGWFTAKGANAVLSSNEDLSDEPPPPIAPDIVFAFLGGLGVAINTGIDFARREKSVTLHLAELFGTATETILKTAIATAALGGTIKAITGHTSVGGSGIENGRTGYDVGQEMVELGLAVSMAVSPVLKKVPISLMRQEVDVASHGWRVFREADEEGISIHIRDSVDSVEADEDSVSVDLPTARKPSGSFWSLIRPFSAKVSPLPEGDVVEEVILNPVHRNGWDG